jgi:hypothetical protein
MWTLTKSGGCTSRGFIREPDRHLYLIFSELFFYHHQPAHYLTFLRGREQKKGLESRKKKMFPVVFPVRRGTFLRKKHNKNIYLGKKSYVPTNPARSIHMSPKLIFACPSFGTGKGGGGNSPDLRKEMYGGEQWEHIYYF